MDESKGFLHVKTLNNYEHHNYKNIFKILNFYSSLSLLKNYYNSLYIKKNKKNPIK
jgi:hypothetical protein